MNPPLTPGTFITSETGTYLVTDCTDGRMVLSVPHTNIWVEGARSGAGYRPSGKLAPKDPLWLRLRIREWYRKIWK